ncbi:MAG TPA: magnesium transporter CorA family protein [Candidatus Paceibacterota bacterium]|nr:magnesium transporter CorA family protein [Candidatus Paceibacterota bacterium]HPD55393.1 magnesium transporter CorA family protein [Candidatus Paceibacterota bacterium]HQM34765.1 magnesium transporter CorA family protein [Candidatus Paceibacterota bacterium]
MIKELHSKISWLDIVNPTEEELSDLQKRFHLHPLIISELKNPSTRTKIEVYDGLMFIVYYLSNYNEKTQISEAIEIDFLLTKDALVSVRYQNFKLIDNLFEKIKNDPSNLLNKTPAHLLHYILEEGLTFSLRQLAHINGKIKKIEDAIFKSNPKSLIEQIAIVKRDILDQRLIARPQHSILESLKERGVQFFGKDLEIYFNDLLGDYEKLWMNLDNLKETIESLENTNNTFFESRTNEIMKILTILAFITFPLTLISSIFSMNTAYMPFVNSPYGFWYVIGLMVLLALLFLAVFKIKKWL